jgi:hypothetical protein
MGLIQKHLVHKSCRAATIPENLRRIKLNIGINVFVRTPNEQFIQVISLIFLKISWRAAAIKPYSPTALQPYSPYGRVAVRR